MKVSEIKQLLLNKKMQNQNTNLKPLKQSGVRRNKHPSKPPKYFVDFANQMLAFVKRQEQFNAKQENFNKQMLEFKIKQEQFNSYVLEQFKRHGWTK